MSLTVGDGVNQLFVYPARASSSGEFTQAVIHVTDVRARLQNALAVGDVIVNAITGAVALEAITALDAIVLFFETIGVLKSPFFNIHITR